jgi:Putative transposase/Transposase zinc-binding domain
MRPVLEVADIFRRHGPAYRQAHADRLGGTERRVMAAIEACRTPALGGHVEHCADCGFVRHAYNSCRDRHCPKCQGLARADWLEARQAELLPVPYFHLVFTVPAPVADLAFHNKAAVYAILFHAATEALRDVAGDPRYLGAETGAIAVLHTWGQALHHHPHLHCIVPGGGISPDQTRWVACPPGFFLPVRVLSRRFRDVFVRQVRAAFASGKLRFPHALVALADPAAFAAHLDAVARIDWVVFTKPPFAGPAQVLGYLSRYTHRVAIANSRLVGLADGQVSFTWKDYRQEGKTKTMTLPAEEFIRRFLQHTVPDGFHRIRHIGFLANGHRGAKLALCRKLLAAPPPEPVPPRRWQDRLRDLTGEDIDACPCCGGRMLTCGIIPPQPPPRPPTWCDSS